MAWNPKDGCPIRGCGKTISSDRSHFDGVPASPQTMLRCVLYQMYVLASSALAMKTAWSEELTFEHPQLGTFTPNESLKIAALVSFRILFDFLYNPKSDDDFSVNDFTIHGENRPSLSTFVGFEGGKMFTKESINKYVAHLTWARINKPKCIPQPKFRRGDRAIVSNAKKLLADAATFVNTVTDATYPKHVKLDRDGQGYRAMFDKAFGQLFALTL